MLTILLQSEQLQEEEQNNYKRTIAEKEEEIERIKSEHIREVNELKSLQTGNEDLNLKRLKKMYADIKKDKQKSEEIYKKDIEDMKKQKAVLEEEIIIGSKESKNKDEERMTILKIFDGMQEMMGKMNSMTKNAANEPASDYACTLCNYKCNDCIVLPWPLGF